MGEYSSIRQKTKGNKYSAPHSGRYADGGRVQSSVSGKGANTTINIGVPQAGAGPPASGPMSAPPAPPPAPPSPAGAGPMPPQAQAMALNAMQGKPGAFKRGGRVTMSPKTRAAAEDAYRSQQAGAASGPGRLQITKAQKRVSKAPGKPAKPSRV